MLYGLHTELNKVEIMITVLVLSLLFLLLASATGFALMSLTDSTTKLFGAQADIDQINRWHSVVSNSLRPYGQSQKLVAPMGSDAGTYHLGLPKNIDGAISLSTKNSYGKELIYCPLSEEVIGSSESATDSIPYQIDASDNITGYDAIVGSYENDTMYVLKIRDFDFLDASLDGEALAILISPLTGDRISCKDVQIDSNGTPVIYDSEGLPAGLVRIINKDEKHSNSINKPVHVETEDYNDATQFNHLVGSYDRIQPSRFILDMHDRGSSYLVTSDLVISSKFPGNKDQFVINAAGAASIIDASVPVTLTFENISVKLNNVTFGDNVSIELKNSLLEITGGSTTLSSVNLINSELFNNSPLTVKNGLFADDSEIKIYSLANITGGLSLSGSKVSNYQELNIDGQLYAQSSTVNINELMSVSGDSFDNILLENSKIYQNSTLKILKKPSFNMYGLSLNGASSFVSKNGTTTIENGESGNPPTNFSIFIDSTSVFSLKENSLVDSDVRHSAFFINYGKMNIDNSNATISANSNYYVTLNGGSELIINNSTFGSANVTNTTINDKGATLISGGGDPTSPFGSSNVSVFGNNCWNNSRPIFNSIFSNSSGYSRANSNSNKTFNSSVWKCNF